MTQNMLAAEHIHYTYQSKYQKVQALRDVSCTFQPGKFYAIVGQSGSGKTTLLSVLAGLGTPDSGSVLVDGVNVEQLGREKFRREKVSVIYQAFNLFPALSILENVMYPMRINKKPARAAKEKARELLAAVGLGEIDGRKLPSMLSGGQQQRVAIARALASDAKIILADEPTGNLDSQNGRIVIELLQGLVREKNYCVIVVTHDPGIAAQADEVYRMTDGEIAKER